MRCRIHFVYGITRYPLNLSLLATVQRDRLSSSSNFLFEMYDLNTYLKLTEMSYVTKACFIIPRRSAVESLSAKEKKSSSRGGWEVFRALGSF